MRARLKEVLEAAMSGSGAPRVGRWWKRGQALVLAFHNVVADELAPIGDASLHLPETRFRSFLDELVRHYDVIPLRSLLSNSSGSSRKPRVAISFDDAYRGALERGIPELARRGLPATVFVAPAFVDGAVFWWDRLDFGSARSRFETFRKQALWELSGEQSAILEWARETGIPEREMPSDLEVASVEDLRRAATLPGITLGSHTWSHPNLAALSADRVRGELEKSRDWLRERFDGFIPWLSYPYGETSPVVCELAEEAGYSAAAVISGGWGTIPPTSIYSVPRHNVPSGLSTRGFALRAAGL